MKSLKLYLIDDDYIKFLRKLIKKVHVFYNLYLKNHLSPNQKTRCCDFKILEKNYKNFGKEEVKQ